MTEAGYLIHDQYKVLEYGYGIDPPKAYLAHGKKEANQEVFQRGFLEHRHDEKPGDDDLHARLE